MGEKALVSQALRGICHFGKSIADIQFQLKTARKIKFILSLDFKKGQLKRGFSLV
jgi:hypothetical protein